MNCIEQCYVSEAAYERVT